MFIKYEMSTVKNNKDNQRESIIIEVTAWAIVLGIVYMLAKVII
jgi:hypothetical protein